MCIDCLQEPHMRKTCFSTDLWIFSKIRFFFLGFCFVAEGSNLLGAGNFATLLSSTRLPHVRAQKINLQPRGTLLQTATLDFILEVGSLCILSFPTGK